eukprot:gene6789-7892_t
MAQQERTLGEVEFQENRKATSNLDFAALTMTSNMIVKFWDTAGQERFRTITKQGYRETDVLLLVYSLDDIETLKSCSDWYTEAKECLPQDKNSKVITKVILIGNKLDLVNNIPHFNQKIFDEQINKLKEDIPNLISLQTSAKLNTGIIDLKYTIIKLCNQIALVFLTGDGLGKLNL